MQIIAITTMIPPTAAPIIALVGGTGLAPTGCRVGVIVGVEGVENGTKWAVSFYCRDKLLCLAYLNWTRGSRAVSESRMMSWFRLPIATLYSTAGLGARLPSISEPYCLDNDIINA
jgi:hypothetical protein